MTQTPAPLPQTPGTTASDVTQPVYVYAAVAPTNMFAIVSLVTSLVGFHIIGVIFGHIALGQIKRTGESGRGLAIAGLVISYLFFAAWIVFLVVWVGLLVLTLGVGVLSTGLSFS